MTMWHFEKIPRIGMATMNMKTTIYLKAIISCERCKKDFAYEDEINETATIVDIYKLAGLEKGLLSNLWLCDECYSADIKLFRKHEWELQYFLEECENKNEMALAKK